jgi:hypothetical protein
MIVLRSPVEYKPYVEPKATAAMILDFGDNRTNDRSIIQTVAYPPVAANP